MKKLLILLLTLSYYTTFAENVEVKEKGYNFIIGTVDSVKSIEVPDSYLIVKKYKEEGSIINILKINNYKVFSSDNPIKENKKKYIYIDPSDRTFVGDKDKLFNKEDIKIGKRIIFKSDILVNNDGFFSPTYYKPSILDLFYDKNNIYIQYEQGFGYFNCKEDNKFEIDIISPKNKDYFYSTLSFINETLFKGDKNIIPKLEKETVEEVINKSGICEKTIINNKITPYIKEKIKIISEKYKKDNSKKEFLLKELPNEMKKYPEGSLKGEILKELLNQLKNY